MGDGWGGALRLRLQAGLCVWWECGCGTGLRATVQPTSPRRPPCQQVLELLAPLTLTLPATHPPCHPLTTSPRSLQILDCLALPAPLPFHAPPAPPTSRS